MKKQKHFDMTVSVTFDAKEQKVKPFIYEMGLITVWDGAAQNTFSLSNVKEKTFYKKKLTSAEVEQIENSINQLKNKYPGKYYKCGYSVLKHTKVMY